MTTSCATCFFLTQISLSDVICQAIVILELSTVVESRYSCASVSSILLCVRKLQLFAPTVSHGIYPQGVFVVHCLRPLHHLSEGKVMKYISAQNLYNDQIKQKHFQLTLHNLHYPFHN